MSTNMPVGSIIYSALEEPAFQNEIGASERWVLADGRSVAGQNTRYEAVSHTAKLPDLRGVFVRGKNNGRTDGLQNPEGDLPVGKSEPDRFKQHDHTGQTGHDTPDHTHGFGGYPYASHYGDDNSAQNLNTGPNGFYRQTDGANTRHIHPISKEGGSETAPKSITLNAFIRIN